MIKNRDNVINEAKNLRRSGCSHRGIARKLHIGLGTAVSFTKDVRLSWEQHITLMKKTGIFKHSKQERAKWSIKGSKNWLARIRYTKEKLIDLIQHFYELNNRIPTKREFNAHWQSFRRIFGT